MWFRKSASDKFFDAVSCGQVKKAKKLKDKIKKKKIEDYFMAAVLNNKLHIVKNLIEIGMDIHFMDDFGYRNSVKYGYEKMIIYFLNLGVDVNHNDGSQLCISLQNKNYDIAKFLIHRGINVNAWRNLPINHAVINNQKEIAELLFSKGATFYPNDIMPTFFHLAEKGKIEMMEFMIEKFNVDILYDFYRVFDHACKGGRLNVIEKFYNENAKNYIQRFLLQTKKYEIIQYFDKIEYNCEKMLNHAIGLCDIKIIKYYMDRLGKTKIDSENFLLAIDTKNLLLVKYLYPLVEKRKNSYLIRSIVNHSIDIFKFLVDQNFSIRKALFEMVDQKQKIPCQMFLSINKYLIVKKINNFVDNEYYILCENNHPTRLMNVRRKDEFCNFCNGNLIKDIYFNG